MLHIKKILTFVIVWVLSANYIFAQNLSLTDTLANDITNDTLLIITGTDETLVSNVIITNNSSGTIQVKVKKIEDYIVLGSTNLFCWGQCFSPSTYVSPNPINIIAGETNENDFYGDYIPNGNQGTSIITYVFFDANSPEDSAFVTVLYQVNFDNIFYSDINAVNFNIYPNPATDYVNICYDSKTNHSSAKIIIYNALGSFVKEIQINDRQKIITVPVNDWESGIYFYTLMVGNNITIRQVVIKH